MPSPQNALHNGGAQDRSAAQRDSCMQPEGEQVRICWRSSAAQPPLAHCPSTQLLQKQPGCGGGCGDGGGGDVGGGGPGTGSPLPEPSPGGGGSGGGPGLEGGPGFGGSLQGPQSWKQVAQVSLPLQILSPQHGEQSPGHIWQVSTALQ